MTTGTSLKLFAHACNQGRVMGSHNLTPTTSPIVSSQNEGHPWAMPTKFIASPPKNFLYPRPYSSKIFRISLNCLVCSKEQSRNRAVARS
ncbi:hypothetical protein CUMW_145910 [Citrus unshiu]|nr:hypothetical protein CUMW_145910 [Citrus unshiu]